MDKCVYQLRLSTDNMPFYVGKGSQERPKQHFFPCERSVRSHKNNVINKAMREGVEILIEYIFTGLTDQEALETEKTIISLYGRPNLTNATDGGDGISGLIRTDDHKRKIGDSNRHSLTDVINKFKRAHGERYDYSLVEYIGCYDPVAIICKVHGAFSQYPQNHWAGRNCPKCAQESRSRTKSTQKRTAEQKKHMSAIKKGKKPVVPKLCCTSCRKEMPSNLLSIHFSRKH